MDPRFRASSRGRIAGVAPAKLNLFLEVLGKRTDGYHELRTVFHEIDLVDEIAVELRPTAPADSLSLSGLAIDGPPEENLVLRAAAAFRRRVPRCPSIHVELRKQVPPGSGMGGGSSDAAFVLRALRHLCSDAGIAELPDDELRSLAREVGADVGFFLLGGTALGAGRGDELTPIAVQERFDFLLALPRFALSTARVYAQVDLIAPRVDVSSFVEGMKKARHGAPLAGCFNRLETAAAQINSAVSALLRELRENTEFPWAMTGSGSALFVPVANIRHAEGVARKVTEGQSIALKAVSSFTSQPGIVRS